jgi:hypothetical protein
MAKKRKRKPGDRFPLLIYRPLLERWGNLGILSAVITFILWLMAPRVLPPRIGQSPIRHGILLATLASILLFFYGIATRKMTYVRCHPTYLHIRSPIMPLNISYRRVSGTRPVQMAKVFNIEEEKRARNTWPERYWGMTAVAVDLKSLPMSERFLRLWLDKHLFNPRQKGFVFLVEDWKEFSSQLTGAISAYRAARLE